MRNMMSTPFVVIIFLLIISGCSDKEKEQLKSQVQSLDKQIELLERQNKELSDENKYRIKLDIERNKLQDQLIAEKKAQLLVDEEIRLKKEILLKEQEKQLELRAKAWVDNLFEERKVAELKRKGEVESIRKDVGICAKIVDSKGNSFQVAGLKRHGLEWSSWKLKGPTFSFSRGGAGINIPFEKVSRAEFKTVYSEQPHVNVNIFLRSGETLTNCRVSMDGVATTLLQGTYMSTRENINFKYDKIGYINFYNDDDYQQLTITDTAIVTKSNNEQKEGYKRTPVIDALLDYSLKRVGANPESLEAKKVKEIAKGAFNPFKSSDQLQRDIDDYVKTIFNKTADT